MKTELQSPDLRTFRAENEISAQLKTLFARLPDLLGFSVQSLREPPADAEPLAGDLYITELELFPHLPNAVRRGELCDEITVALLELLCNRPDARELLTGRTFARVLH
jgi:hypothetical protein